MIAIRAHVDEVDDHQSAHIAKAQLPGNLIGCLEVRIDGCLFDVGTASSASRVNVDRDQCLGRIDDNRATGGQFDFSFERTLNLAFDLIAVEEGEGIRVELYAAFVLRHHLLDESHCLVKGLLGVE